MWMKINWTALLCYILWKFIPSASASTVLSTAPQSVTAADDLDPSGVTPDVMLSVAAESTALSTTVQTTTSVIADNGPDDGVDNDDDDDDDDETANLLLILLIVLPITIVTCTLVTIVVIVCFIKAMFRRATEETHSLAENGDIKKHQYTMPNTNIRKATWKNRLDSYRDKNNESNQGKYLEICEETGSKRDTKENGGAKKRETDIQYVYASDDTTRKIHPDDNQQKVERKESKKKTQKQVHVQLVAQESDDKNATYENQDKRQPKAKTEKKQKGETQTHETKTNQTQHKPVDQSGKSQKKQPHHKGDADEAVKNESKPKKKQAPHKAPDDTTKKQETSLDANDETTNAVEDLSRDKQQRVLDRPPSQLDPGNVYNNMFEDNEDYYANIKETQGFTENDQGKEEKPTMQDPASKTVQHGNKVRTHQPAESEPAPSQTTQSSSPKPRSLDESNVEVPVATNYRKYSNVDLETPTAVRDGGNTGNATESGLLNGGEDKEREAWYYNIRSPYEQQKDHVEDVVYSDSVEMVDNELYNKLKDCTA